MCRRDLQRTKSESFATAPPAPPNDARPPHPAYVYSTGSTYGNRLTTPQAKAAMIRQRRLAGDVAFDEAFASRVLDKCGFDHHSFALPREDVFRRLTREEYLEARRIYLVDMAVRAARQALERWGGDGGEITHLFWGTMTGGMDSPTIDIKLVGELGLNGDVERTSIEGMGCLTGFRLLNLARQVAQGDPSARILVVSGDLRSALGNSMPQEATREDVVAVSLFRDAASAAVVGGSDYDGGAAVDGAIERGECAPRFELVAGLSRIVEGTGHLVQYFETNDGAIRLLLDRELPDHIGKAEPDFVRDLLEKGRKATKRRGGPRSRGSRSSPQAGALGTTSSTVPTIDDLDGVDVLCHTGGPRVLREVAKALGVQSQNLHSSLEVMRNNGNLSGASNLCVLDHHSQLADLSDLNMDAEAAALMGMGSAPARPTSEWAVGLSMGPGVCLEGVLLRDVRRKAPPMSRVRSMEDFSSVGREAITRGLGEIDTRKAVHIVGGGIAGFAVAAALDPRQFQVRVFEASKAVGEKGYGLAIWPSTMKILRDELQIKFLDLRKTRSMAIHRKGTDETLVIEPPHQNPDKGFMKRSSLLRCLLDEVKARHGAHAISTDHKCLRVRLGAAKATATYEHAGSAVSHACDLLVGADGVHSTVRRYVALTLDSRAYGRMTAYRFLVPSPSKELLRKTEKTWNMSISDSIHSPCYHVSNHDDALNVVVLEYDGKPPSRPRPAKLSEVRDVARRSNLDFVIQILDFEHISDLMCYSTYHVDCEPWHQPQAVLVGDAAHAYGPLTAKMANLAINDAHSLGMMLNSQRGRRGVAQAQVLREWEDAQRPKFEATRVRTLRHLQLYAPCVRTVVTFLWRLLPGVILEYFGSIFAYDYEVYSSSGRSKSCLGLVGVNRADPLVSFLPKWAFRFGTLLILPMALLCHFIMWRTERM